MAVVFLFHFVQLTEGRYARDIPKQLPSTFQVFSWLKDVTSGTYPFSRRYVRDISWSLLHNWSMGQATPFQSRLMLDTSSLFKRSRPGPATLLHCPMSGLLSSSCLEKQIASALCHRQWTSTAQDSADMIWEALTRTIFASIVALGKTKAMHEFLVLHYFAMDSAKGWDSFLSQCLPHGDWVRSDVRRATLMNMFDACHVPPSHRRPAHQSWAASLLLMLDLILGGGKARYLRSGPATALPAEVKLRGFSAGSFSGLCLCHLLWRLPNITVKGTLGGIAVPPALLKAIPQARGQQLTLFHLTADALCQWDPSKRLLESLPCRYCIVGNLITELHGTLARVNTPMGIGWTWTCHMASLTYWTSYGSSQTPPIRPVGMLRR